MEKLKLKDHPYCKCYVLKENNVINFISYTTTVIIAVKSTENENEWHLVCTGTYSQTTQKQISWFLREYFPLLNYYNIKEIAGKEKIIVYNSNTEKFYIKNDIAK